MAHRNIVIANLLVFSWGAFAQAPAARPQFEAAEIRRNISGGPSQGGALPGGQISVRNLSLNDVLQFAFNTHTAYVAGAPNWFETDHFDIVAKAPAGTEDNTLRLMLQALLADRFKLNTHIEQRAMDVFALVVGKNGPKLQKATEPGKLDCKRSVVRETLQAELICKNLTMADLASVLPDYAPAYVDRMVVDQTGLTGAYDIKLNWVGLGQVDQGGLTMFDALDKFLGLKLEAKKLPVPIVVIDHAERLAD